MGHVVLVSELTCPSVVLHDLFLEVLHEFDVTKPT